MTILAAPLEDDMMLVVAVQSDDATSCYCCSSVKIGSDTLLPGTCVVVGDRRVAKTMHRPFVPDVAERNDVHT